MLNIGVVVDRVANDMVHVVRPLPPADRDSSKEVTNHYSENVINHLNMRYSVVTKVVANESELLPEASKQDSSSKVSPVGFTLESEVQSTAEDSQDAGHSLVVKGVVCLKHAFSEQLLSNSSMFFHELSFLSIFRYNCSHLEVLKEFVNFVRVVLDESICSIFTGHSLKGQMTSRMTFSPCFRDLVSSVSHHNPAVF